ncbi:MAG: cell division protein FtsZ [Paludibacteraceae bacterium]|nr:cell division protein FtsZ [Paludibacteraceae bacterium]
MEDEVMTLPLEGLTEDSIIKVIGVGGGGCNAVNYMHRQGLQDVSFLVCNTDRQVLIKSSVPSKLQLGPGLGAGGDPETARQYAEESREHIREALNDGTQMLFIAAGMGGGTGTGASSVVAEVAQEMGILTVGIVTIPFAFEGKRKIEKAMTGVARLAKHVDALLIINNEKLKQIYPELNLLNAFSKSDDVVANAARAIAEIITVPGYINTDFADVRNTLRKGGVAIMNIGRASGEQRITNAINDALNSPLVNTNDVHGAERILLQFYCSTEHAIVMEEIDQINAFVQEVGDDIEVQWGASIDESLGEQVRVTVIATGYKVDGLPSEEEEAGKKTISEAIEDNYPQQANKPLEDEKATLIDLSETLRAEGIEEPRPVRPNAVSPSADDIVITMEEEEIKMEEPQETRHSPFGWIRRK